MVQWLGIKCFHSRGPGSIPVWGTRILKPRIEVRKNNKKTNKNTPKFHTCKIPVTQALSWDLESPLAHSPQICDKGNIIPISRGETEIGEMKWLVRDHVGTLPI